MVEAVVGRGRVREHLIEGDVIRRHLVDVLQCDRRGNRRTRDGQHGNVQDIIAEAAAVREATRHGSTGHSARQEVFAEEAQPGKVGVVDWPGQARGRRGQIHLDHIGNIDGAKVRGRAEQGAQLHVGCVLLNSAMSFSGLVRL